MRERNPSSYQTLYLFLGFLILFVVSFSLGVVLGKKLSSYPETQTVREEGGTEPPRKEFAELEKETSTVKQEEQMAPQIPAPATQTEDMALQAPASIEQGEPEPETAEVEEPSAPQAQAPDRRVGGMAEQTPASAESVEEGMETEAGGIEGQTSTPSNSEESLKVEAEKGQPVQDNIASPPEFEAEGKYTVQIGSFQEEGKAKSFVEALKSKGYPVFIKQTDVPGQGAWYRVRVGKFKTREDARLYGDNLKNQEPDIVKLVFITLNN